MLLTSALLIVAVLLFLTRAATGAFGTIGSIIALVAALAALAYWIHLSVAAVVVVIVVLITILAGYLQFEPRVDMSKPQKKKSGKAAPRR